MGEAPFDWPNWKTSKGFNSNKSRLLAIFSLCVRELAFSMGSEQRGPVRPWKTWEARGWRWRRSVEGQRVVHTGLFGLLF